VIDGVQRLKFEQVLETRGQMMTYGPAVLDAAREVADVVVIDCPSLLTSHDALTLLPGVDVVIVVAEYGVTKADAASKASDLLNRFGAPVLGVVLTNVRNKKVEVAPIGQLPAPTGGTRPTPAQLQP